MRIAVIVLGLFALIATSCNGTAIERIRDRGESPPAPSQPAPNVSPDNQQSGTVEPVSQPASVTINGYSIDSSDLAWLESSYGLYVESGDYWYDPVSGAWGYWGGPTAGFLNPYMELGYAPADASGGGTGVFLNGRELHPVDLAGLQQLLGYIYPGAYWLDAQGYFGYEGGQALGNLIYVAQGAGSSAGGGYHDSTYFGNIGSDGQSSYFYDSDSGCSVMSDGGLSC